MLCGRSRWKCERGGGFPQLHTPSGLRKDELDPRATLAITLAKIRHLLELGDDRRQRYDAPRRASVCDSILNPSARCVMPDTPSATSSRACSAGPHWLLPALLLASLHTRCAIHAIARRIQCPTSLVDLQLVLVACLLQDLRQDVLAFVGHALPRATRPGCRISVPIVEGVEPPTPTNTHEHITGVPR